MLNFLLILALITFALLYYCIYVILFYKKNLIQNRLKANVLAQDPNEELVQEEKSYLSIRKRILTILGKILPYKKYILKYKKKLAQANILMKPEEFFGISVLSGVLAALLLFYLLHHVIMLFLGLIIGFIVPDFVLSQVKNTRAKKLNSQLPEALNIISNGIRAGYSFTQAMSSASKELQQPISDEFQKIIRDNALGKPMEEALLAVSDRTEDEDIDMFVTALIIQRQVGGNLSEILDTISNTIRERVRVKGEIRTLTAQGKFSAVIISILPIFLAVIIYMFNPNYINLLLANRFGIIALCIAVVMEITGILILKKMVNIAV
jgi:tight adherence protein B